MRNLIINLLSWLAYAGIFLSGIVGGVGGVAIARRVAVPALRKTIVGDFGVDEVLGIVLGVPLGFLVGILVFGIVFLLLDIRDRLGIIARLRMINRITEPPSFSNTGNGP